MVLTRDQIRDLHLEPIMRLFILRSICSLFSATNCSNPQWKFSCQKGMKNNFWAKAGLEPGTAEFPQRDELTIEPHS